MDDDNTEEETLKKIIETKTQLEALKTKEIKFDPNNIKLIKTSDGQTLVFYLKGIIGNFMLTEYPVRVVNSIDQNSEMVNYGFTPYNELGKMDMLSININHVITLSETTPETKKMYQEFLVHFKNHLNSDHHKLANDNINTKANLIWENKNHPLFNKDTSKKSFLNLVKDDDPNIH